LRHHFPTIGIVFSILLIVLTVDSLGQALLNLTPTTPLSWSAPIVVSTTSGTNTDASSILSTDTLFIDWAVINDGNDPTSSSYLVTLSVDGKNQLSWIANPPHNANVFVFVEDFQLGSLSPGTHTLTITADSESAVGESNESDNVFSRQIEITAALGRAQEVFIYFPRIQEDGSSSSGVAIANPTDESAEVELFLIDNDGSLVEGAGIVNPSSLTIPSNNQIARTITELFGQAVGDVEGWILASSENLGIVGFSLTFSQDITRLDGAEATVFPASTTVVFPEILAGEESFTEISVIGSGPIDLNLYDKDGTLVETQKIDLPTDVLGRFSGKLDGIFSTPMFSDGYVLARCKQFRIMGYEHFGSDSFFAGLNAIPVSGVGRELPIALFGAELVDIPEIQSMITIINPTNTSAELTISVFETGSSDGTPEASKTTSLAPGSKLRFDARSFLDLPSEDRNVGR